MKVSILDMVDGSDGGEGLSSCQSTSGGSFGEKIGCIDRPCQNGGCEVHMGGEVSEYKQKKGLRSLCSAIADGIAKRWRC